MTGIVSRIIHSGRLSDSRNAETTFRRLIARCCFWPFEVLIVSRSSCSSASRSSRRSSSRIASAPMPPSKYTPKPHSEPKRSFSSRNRRSSATTSLGLISEKRSNASRSVLIRSSDASSASLRRVCASRYASRTLIAHCSMFLTSSFDILPSVLRQRSLTRSRTSPRSSGAVSAWVRTVSASSPAPRPRALSSSRWVALSPRAPRIFSICSGADRLVVLARQVAGELVERLAGVALGRALALVDLDDVVRGRLERCGRVGGDQVELARVQLAILADGDRAHQLADLLRVLAGDASGDVLQQAVGQVASHVERLDALLLGPRVERAGPVLVVLVEAVLGAGGEVVAAARQALLDGRELLLLVEVQLLDLGLDLVAQLAEVGQPLLVVHPDHDGRGEVQDLLELLRRDVEQVADPARHALEEPDVRDRARPGRCDPCARGAPSGA